MLMSQLPDTQITVLEPTWFTRPTCVVAADLIGKVLCRQLIDNGGEKKIVRMRISETEAYIGEGDAACHAHARRVPRLCIAKAVSFMFI